MALGTSSETGRVSESKMAEVVVRGGLERERGGVVRPMRGSGPEGLSTVTVYVFT